MADVNELTRNDYNKAMADTIFTKIIKGEIPAHKLYEDERTFAFLDIHPKTPGHTLVIPKRQVEFVWDLDETDYQAVMATAKKVAERLRTVLGYPYVGELVFGMDVPHAHVHVYGFTTAEEARRIPGQATEPDHAALADLAKQLAF
jgi:histidine triad (HIT) family protein